LPKSRCCEVQYAVSTPAAFAYSQTRGAEWSACRVLSGEIPDQRTPSEIAVVESTLRICMSGMRSRAASFENGVIRHSGS